MFRLSTAIISALLIMLFATVQTNAATAKWDTKTKSNPYWEYFALGSTPKKSFNTIGKNIVFGTSVKGGGPSRLSLYSGAGPKTRGVRSNSKSIFTLAYYNAVNKMSCILFSCTPPKTQRHSFRVFEKGKLVSRGKVYVRSTRNPKGDVFRLKVNYLAKGYSWIGAGKRSICEKCTFFAQLLGPKTIFKRQPPQPLPETPLAPSPVPVPPALAMMLAGMFGLFGIGRFKRT